MSEPVVPDAQQGDELDTLGESKTVLLLSSDDISGDTVCSSLLSRVSATEAKLLGITLEKTPDEQVDEWRAQMGELPEDIGVIAVGETTRSVSATAPTGPGPMLVSVDTIGDASDLTGIAMAIGAYLDAWSEASETPIVCFDSVTGLLFHADRSRVFRFLHATVGRLREIGAVAHYHLDPSAHDEGTINAFSALFDAVVRVEDGEVTVQSRR